MFYCGDCERYKSADGDRPKVCPATGRRVWPGDDAEECPYLVALLEEGALIC